MVKNFYVLALRNLLKRKLFSFINILGLALGVAACLIILKYIDFETSYDSYHKNADQVFRITRSVFQNNEKRVSTVTTTYGLGPALAAEMPEIKRYIRTHPMYGNAAVIYQPKSGEQVAFLEKNIQIVDSTFLRAFTYQSIEGNLETALDNPNSIVITKLIAEKYFGKEDPIGKTLTLSGGWCDADYTVSAVIENVPENSHFYFELLVPLHNIFLGQQYKKDSGWDWNNFVTYIELNESVTRQAVDAKISDFAKRIIDVKNIESNIKTVLEFQPLRDIHLQTGLLHDDDSISRNTIYFFGLIAIFILVIAWINYTNLSTARAMERAREVGIKKSIGAFRIQLVLQFFLESLVINFLGIALAVVLAIALLPILAEIIGKHLSFDFEDRRLWFTLAGLFLFGSLASGAYPSFALSSFRITDVIKGRSEKKGFSLRKGLVVFQFTSSLILIAGTFVVYRQIMYMRTHDKGLTMDQMLIVGGPNTLRYYIAKQKLALFKEEVKKIPGVTSVATSGAIPGGGHNWGADVRRSGTQPNEARSGSIVWVDADFIHTYNMKLLAGRNFNPSLKSDMKSALVNEASLTAFGLGTAEEALKESVIMGNDTIAIIGVLKNYNWNSMKREHIPFLLRTDTIVISNVSVHLAGSIPSSMQAIEKLYKELIPGDPYQYYFLDDFFNEQYRSDQQFGKIFGLFAILAVAISCLGLSGLASFTTAQRLKEIGVRKVLGATSRSIVVLLSQQFLKLVFIAAVIAIPLSWYGIDSWLHGFAFRISLQWYLFAIPVLILTIITLLTVSLQVLKGATSNPATVLKSE